MNKPIRNDPLIDVRVGRLPKIPTITEVTSPFGGVDFPAMAGVGGVFQYAVAAEVGEARRAQRDHRLDALHHRPQEPDRACSTTTAGLPLAWWIPPAPTRLCQSTPT